ncbi:hypothetical protein COOONC_14593 [Cooperia oncophora]
MCGGPLFGTIVQKFGIRYALHLCYGSTMISGVLLFLSYDVKTLLLSRIPCIFMHGQQGHQTLLSALTEPGKERTNAFGRMGLTFGLGFVFTPIFSFISTSFLSMHGPIMVSAALCIILYILVHGKSVIPRSSYKRTIDSTREFASMSVSNVARILNKTRSSKRNVQEERSYTSNVAGLRNHAALYGGPIPSRRAHGSSDSDDDRCMHHV